MNPTPANFRCSAACCYDAGPVTHPLDLDKDRPFNPCPPSMLECCNYTMVFGMQYGALAPIHAPPERYNTGIVATRHLWPQTPPIHCSSPPCTSKLMIRLKYPQHHPILPSMSIITISLLSPVGPPYRQAHQWIALLGMLSVGRYLLLSPTSNLSTVHLWLLALLGRVCLYQQIITLTSLSLVLFPSKLLNTWRPRTGYPPKFLKGLIYQLWMNTYRAGMRRHNLFHFCHVESVHDTVSKKVCLRSMDIDAGLQWAHACPLDVLNYNEGVIRDRVKRVGGEIRRWTRP